MNYEEQIDHLMNSAQELVSKLHDTDNSDVHNGSGIASTNSIRKDEDRKPPRGLQHSMKITRIPSSLLE